MAFLWSSWRYCWGGVEDGVVLVFAGGEEVDAGGWGDLVSGYKAAVGFLALVRDVLLEGMVLP